MGKKKIDLKEGFDPFKFNFIFGNRKEKPIYTLTAMGMLMVVVLLIVNFVQGTFGKASDFQFVDDVLRAVGVRDVPQSQHSFPLARDVPSWFLLFTVVAGTMLLLKHWKLVADCLPDLARSGALVNRDEFRSTVVSRWTRVDRMLAEWRATTAQAAGTDGGPPPPEGDAGQPEDALTIVISKIMKRLQARKARITGILLFLAVILSLLLVHAEQHGLFQTFAPSDLTGSDRHTWLEDAYTGWWASQNHFAGFILYFIYTFIGIFIILSFNFVAIISVYIVVVMNCVALPSADWLNRDGRYGWMPVTRIFRTAYWADILLGATLTVVLYVLGLNNFWWVGVLVILYIILLPIEIIIPWLVFRRVETSARDARIRDLEELITTRGIDIDRDIEAAAPIIAEIERCHATRIRPMRLRGGWFSTFVLLVLLPIILAAAQIFFPLVFSAR